MKQVECTECQQLAPMSQTLLVKQRPVCGACAKGVLAQRSQRGLRDEDVVRAFDPTVCTQCNSDNGEEEYSQLAGLPICPECERKFRNWPYPAWLKISFAALVGLAIFSFAWNWRFMAAFREIRQMNRALGAGDAERAADLAESAARHVPEVPELVGVAQFNRGLDLMSKDQSAKALEYLRKAKQGPGSGQLPEINRVVLEAEAGAAFEAKNYDEFLAKSKAIAAQFPGDFLGPAKLASACACKYAATGSEEYRQEALKHLDRASKLTATKEAQAALAEYRPRILHRLETREIISAAEFHQRFPNGYQSKAKP